MALDDFDTMSREECKEYLREEVRSYEDIMYKFKCEVAHNKEYIKQLEQLIIKNAINGDKHNG